MSVWNRVKHRSFFIKLFNWEYWPSKAFYYPVAPYLIFLMVRARHMCFFSAANPGIYSGGMGLESKFQTLQIIPEYLRPKSIFLKQGTSLTEIRIQLSEAGITYPFIAKPDLGFRGLLVKKIRSEGELKAYLEQFPLDFILQELIDLPEEIGVLYYRMPGKEKGQISSITTKEFLTVTGDGKLKVQDLIKQHPRALLQWDRINQQMPEILDAIPAKGEKVPLGIVGNHAKGTRFINSNASINEEMISTFDEIANQIEGFYYGRFDLKCTSFDSLKTGEGIRVIELNGVCSEPTHIYDPERGTYFEALRAIVNNWSTIYKIAKKNRKKGIKYETHQNIAQSFLDLFAYQRRIKELENNSKG